MSDIGTSAGVAAIFLLLNVGIGWMIKALTHSAFLAWAIPAVSYYILIRKLCIYIVFPGSFFGYKRRLEIAYQETMGNVVLE